MSPTANIVYKKKSISWNLKLMILPTIIVGNSIFPSLTEYALSMPIHHLDKDVAYEDRADMRRIYYFTVRGMQP